MSLENPFEPTTPSSTPEKLPGRTQLEQEQHLLVMRNIVKGLGFDETEEMKVLSQTNMRQWADRAQDLIEAAGTDHKLRMKLTLGYQLALAALYYELKETTEYTIAIDEVLDLAYAVDPQLADSINTICA